MPKTPPLTLAYFWYTHHIRCLKHRLMGRLQLSALLFWSLLILAEAHAGGESLQPVWAPDTSALITRVCEQLHQSAPTRRANCCAQSNATATLAPLCVSTLKPMISAGKLRIDEEALAMCEFKRASQLHGCDWVAALPPALPDSCAQMVVGLADEYGACTESTQCSPGLSCRQRRTDGAQVCLQPLPAGARCSAAGGLLDGLSGRKGAANGGCIGTCARGRCVAIGHRSTDSPNATLAGCKDGSCKRRAGGESCGHSLQCRSMVCSNQDRDSLGVCTDVCESGVAAKRPFSP